ncbi:hypothetical protein [Chryseobacterium binzhouense]|uniref:hypothetical protein n=1 Tax=Chryseobacterium binzhouense TaxID=2593646 RepID=UPI00117EE955|nr:hypothetical protein [Chryseobacterium binzhouense]
MKTLKREKSKLHLQNNLYVLFFLFLSNFLFSQKFEDYYLTNKLITFKNPIIIVPNSNKVGIFVVEKEDYDKQKNLNKLFTKKKAFLFDKDNFLYEIFRDIKKTNYEEENYNYTFRKEEGNTIILELNEKIKSFYIGFIKLQYYNHTNASAHARYPFIKNTNDYEPILIPYFPD